MTSFDLKLANAVRATAELQKVWLPAIAVLSGALAPPALNAAVPTAANGLPVSDTNIPAGVDRMFEQVVKVAPHVWAFHPPGSAGMAPLPNEMVVEQSDGLVLIDSGKTRGAGRRIVALIRSISSKPVKAVILTHWHQDHVLGLGPVVETWPGVSIIASEGTTKDIDTDPSYVGISTSPEGTEPRAAARAAAFKQYAKLFRPKVQDPTLTARQHQGWAEMVGVLDQRALDEKGTYLVRPTKTFVGRFRIEDSKAPVEAIEVGRGHSDSDVVVWAPRQRVLASGDQVVAPVPYPGSNLLDWPAALDRVLALDPRILIPGHGDLQRGTSYVAKERAAFASVNAKARSLPITPVLSDDAVRERTNLQEQRDVFTHGDPWLSDMFDQYFADSAVLAYHELTGQKP